MRLPFHFSSYCDTLDTMFMYLFNVCLFKGEFELRGISWCFWRVAITIRFVFAGCTIIELEPHQSATSLRLPWRDVSTNCMFFPRIWRDESSANRSLLTLSFDICSCRSLMNMQNRSGPSTEPWGTPYLTSAFDDDSLLRKTYCDLFVR